MSGGRPELKQPYLGLRPFDEPDAPLYLGREVQVDAALAQLEDHAFLAVVGSSGSGKSSLVKAGLLPAVRDGFLLARKDWVVLKMRPGHEPYQNLARELADVLPAVGGAKAILPKLRASERGLVTVIAERAPSSAVLVVVDQFEELFAFRHVSESSGEIAERDEAAVFVRLLLWSCSVPNRAVRVVLTMRSDFIGDCEVFLGLPEAISRSQFLVPRLDRTQLQEAIIRPSRVRGASFAPFTFEPELENRIINDAGDRPDQLPLMQHALLRTWKLAAKRSSGLTPVQVTLADYEAVGEIERGLSLDADAAWLAIAGDSRLADLTRRVFLLLCDVSPDAQITRRRPRADEVLRVTGAGLEELRYILRTFQSDDRNFLLPPADTLTAQSTLDISHESLIRQWKMFNDWVVTERSSSATLIRLRERAQRWPAFETVLAGPALTAALAWRDTDRPTSKWAERYGGGLDDVDRYLDESKAERQREVDRLEAERRREAEREEAERRREAERAEAARQAELAEAQRREADAQSREAEAHHREREQRESARRFRWLATALAVLLVIASAAAFWAWQQERQIRVLSGGLEARDKGLKERDSALEARDRLLVEQGAALRAEQSRTDAQGKQLNTQRDQLDDRSRQLQTQTLALRDREEKLVEAELSRRNLAGQLADLNGQAETLRAQQATLQVRSVAMEKLVGAGGVVTGAPEALAVELLADVERGLGGGPDQVLEALPQLGPVYSLTLRRTRVTDAGLASVAALKDLRVLDLSSTDVTDAGVEAILALPRLQRLVLDDTRITQASLQRLTQMPSLQALAVSHTRVTGQAVKRFKDGRPGVELRYEADPLLEAWAETGTWEAAFRRVDGASIRGSSVAFAGSPITDAALKFLGDFTELTLIACANITDDGLRNLRNSSKLEKLTLTKVDEVTSRGLGHLADLDALRELTVSSQVLSMSGAAAIARIRSLRVLTIDSSEVTDRMVAGLVSLEQLEELSIDFALGLTDLSLESLSKLRSLRVLKLGGVPRVTGAGIGGLSALPALRELEVEIVSLTDDDVAQLTRLKGLARLTIRDHEMTTAGVARLRAGLGGTLISIDNARAVPTAAAFLSDDEEAVLRDLPTAGRSLALGPAVSGRLTTEDRRVGSTLVQAWTLPGCDGMVQIDLRSADFDPVLVVMNPESNEFLQNDDADQSLNSRLRFACGAGPYKVIVTSIGTSMSGGFSLQVTPAEDNTIRPGRR